jgi:hypothetical protein
MSDSPDDTTMNAHELLTYLGIGFTLNPGDLIAGAVIVAKVIDTDGDVVVRTSWSDGLDIFQRVGLFRTAERQELHDLFESEADQ